MPCYSAKEVADKFFRRVLRLFKEPQINLIAKKHNIDRKLNFDQKIKEIIVKEDKTIIVMANGSKITTIVTNNGFTKTILSDEKNNITMCNNGNIN